MAGDRAIRAWAGQSAATLYAGAKGRVGGTPPYRVEFLGSQIAEHRVFAFGSGDTSAVERILAEDFVGVDPKGNFYDKATMIANTRQAPKYFVSNRIGKVTVRFFGMTAVAQGEESWVRHQGERGRFVWTDTWVHRNGKWQIVAAQDASVKDTR